MKDTRNKLTAPAVFNKKLWLNLKNNYLSDLCFD